MWSELLIAIALFFIFVKFTKAREGTGKIITRFDGVVKVFIQWLGWYKNKNGDVVTGGPQRRWYGGLRVWLGTPFDKAYTYNLRFHSIEEIEGKRVPVYHEIKNADYVQLRPDRYWRKSLEVETKDGQFPDIEWLVGMRSINPEKTIFKAPSNWVENALTELEPTLRQYGRTKNLDKLLNLTREQIWKDIGNDHAIQIVLKNEWGIKIDEQEIGILNVILPPEYQKALAAESKAKMEAKAVQTKAEIEAIARAAETIGTVIEMMARARGKKPEEIQKEIDADPKLKAEFLSLSENLLIRKLGMESGSRVDIGVEGAEGIERLILNSLAAWQRMPMGPTGEAKKEKPEGKPEGEKPAKEETKEEKEKKEEENEIEKGKLFFEKRVKEAKEQED